MSAAPAVRLDPSPDVVAPHGADFVVCEARSSDNDALISLAAGCPMVGDLSLRIDRGPDFFALNRLEGERWRVAVAERHGRVVGCVAFSERRVFVNGREMRTAYVGDLKVHPEHRDTKVADTLSFWAENACADLPPRSPCLITVLAGNTAMERRLSGPRGVPRFNLIGTIRSHSIPILWKRKRGGETSAIATSRAEWADLPEMVALWNRVAAGRQLAPVHTVQSLTSWIRQAPGLDIPSYLAARSATGELLGFIGVWDQRSFKQLTVVGYSRRMSAVRAAFNLAAPVVGAERLPREGAPLRCATVVNVCIPPEDAGVLRTLLLKAHNNLRGSGISFLNVGLDVKDPLSKGIDGLLGQPTDVNAYVLAQRGGMAPERLDARPLHYEIALV